MRRDVRDLELFAACFNRNGSPRTADALRWQYVENPTGDMYVDLAVAGDSIAAIYATLPVRVRLDGRVRVALQSLDTLTDAAFRGKGLFVKLARATFTRATDARVGFVYGFPNGSSAPGFFGKLGWTKLDPVPFLIRPLRTGYVAKRLKLDERLPWIPDLPLARAAPPVPRQGERIEHVERFDERFSALWSRFVAPIGVAVERDAAYLNWRLVDKPGAGYTRLAVMFGEDVLAFTAYRVSDKHGGRVGYVMDLLYVPGRADAARFLLRHTIADMTSRGADVVLAWSLPHSPNFRTFLRNGFAPFPARLRPIELHFGAKPLGDDARAITCRTDWYLSYLDSDTV
jgi:hypothetical protein